MDLRKYLETRGIKTTFFASELGLNRCTLYRYMNGKQATPKYLLLAVQQLSKGKITAVCDKSKRKPNKENNKQEDIKKDDHS